MESKLQSIARKSKNQAEADRRVGLELHKWLRSGDAAGSTTGFRNPPSL